MASGPVIQLVPFAQLPACAQLCGFLFDVNGKCVPPGAPTSDQQTYERCFCSDARLAPFRSSPRGVCDSACPTSPSDLAAIQNWYQGFCSKYPSPAATSSNIGGSVPTGGSSSGSTGGGGGDWLSNHWKWVVMIVVITVAIITIWIGACIWRKRYLRKKEHRDNAAKRNSGQGPWGPNGAGDMPMAGPNASAVSQQRAKFPAGPPHQVAGHGRATPPPGAFMAAGRGPYSEKSSPVAGRRTPSRADRWAPDRI